MAARVSSAAADAIHAQGLRQRGTGSVSEVWRGPSWDGSTKAGFGQAHRGAVRVCHGFGVARRVRTGRDLSGSAASPRG